MLRFFSQMLRICAVPLLLFSQSFTGSISGLVTDSSGAVVPQAAITVTDLGRNTRFRTESNDSGFYLVGQLSPGKLSRQCRKGRVSRNTLLMRSRFPHSRRYRWILSSKSALLSIVSP